jgi:hypothetical protein
MFYIETIVAIYIVAALKRLRNTDIDRGNIKQSLLYNKLMTKPLCKLPSSLNKPVFGNGTLYTYLQLILLLN